MIVLNQTDRFRMHYPLMLVYALTLAGLVLWLAPTQSVQAADVTVNSELDDDATNNETGCSLREAVLSVNLGANQGGCIAQGSAYGINDLIIAPAGIYTLTIDDGDFGIRDINVAASVVISGAGVGVTVVQANTVHPTDPSSTPSRVFQVTGSAAAVEMRDMTIRYGRMYGAQSGHPAGKHGGAIRNDGGLTLARVDVRSNWVISTNTTSNHDARGGGIYSNGALTLTDSTVADNIGTKGGGVWSDDNLIISGTTIYSNSVLGTSGDGGGLWVQGAGGWIINSTVSGNRAVDLGSGIRNQASLLSLVHTSVISNAGLGDEGGGIISDAGGTVVLTNTLVANNRAFAASQDCFVFGGSALSADANNMDSDGSCDNATQKTPTEIAVGPLADNGGPTWTHALLSLSAAIDSVPSANCAASTDQRGVVRPQGAGCDAGAFEELAVCFADVGADATTDFASVDASAVQDAINLATAGQTILLAGYCKGVNSSGGTDQTGHLYKNLTIRGGYLDTDWTVSDPDAHPTTLDADKLGRVLLIDGGVSVTVESVRMIRGTETGAGGGVWVDDSTATFSNTQVYSSSTTSHGGGIAATGSSAVLTVTSGSEIAWNSAESVDPNRGGGVYNNGGAVRVEDSRVYSNTSEFGGGIDNRDGTMTVVGSQVVSNTVAKQGGGIFSQSTAANLNVTDGTLVAWNKSVEEGGGIYNQNGSALIQGSEIRSNRSDDFGGGIFNSNGAVTVDNSDVLSNHTDQDGGGIRSSGASAVLIVTSGSRIAFNATTGGTNNDDGGGVSNKEGTAHIVNSQVYSNTADNGGGLHNNDGKLILAATHVLTNVVPRDAGGIYNVGSSALLSTSASSLIQHNRAGRDGGGIFNKDGTVALGETEIISNTGEDYGGGLHNDDGQAILYQGVQVISNTATYGGGLYNIHSSGVLIVGPDNLVQHNVGAEGGGIYIQSGLGFISAQVIANTSADEGGGILNSGDTQVIGAQVLSNTAAGEGGGIYNAPGSAISITAGSLIQHNSATTGGGLYNRAGGASAGIGSSSIISNSAQDGGGIYNEGTLTVAHNSLIQENYAVNLGGGIATASGATTVDGSRLLNNAVGSNGGAFHQQGGTSRIANSCIVNNRDTAVVYAGGTSPITAIDNWWGSVTGPSGAGLGSGDSVSTDVTFNPFLGAAILGCPILDPPELGVEKTVNDNNPESNDTITYTVVISNGGDGPATGGILSDVIPTGLTYVANSATLDPAGAGTVGAPPQLVTGLTITAGTSVTLTFQATVNGGLEDGLTITNTASVTATNHVTPTTDSITLTVASLDVEDITVELDLAGMAITNFESGGGGYGAGILDWVWTILNPNPEPVSNIYFDVVQLSPPGVAVVHNADGGPAGQGARVSVPNSALGPDGQLTDGETYAQLFEIGWNVYAGFTFQVRAFGVVGTPLVAGEPQLLGAFTVEFDPGMVDVDGSDEGQGANKIFLPLIQK